MIKIKEENKRPNNSSSSRNIKLTSRLHDVSEIKISKKGNNYFLVILDNLKVPFFKRDPADLEKLRNDIVGNIGKTAEIWTTPSGYGVSIDFNGEESGSNQREQTDSSLISLVECPNCKERMLWSIPELGKMVNKTVTNLKDIHTLLLRYGVDNEKEE